MSCDLPQAHVGVREQLAESGDGGLCLEGSGPPPSPAPAPGPPFPAGPGGATCRKRTSEFVSSLPSPATAACVLSAPARRTASVATSGCGAPINRTSSDVFVPG